MRYEESNGSSFLGFLGGFGIGIAAGLLFAPKPGVEIRQDIEDRAKETSDKVTKAATEFGAAARESIDKRVNDVYTAVDDVRNRVRTSVEAGKQAYEASMAAYRGPGNRITN